MLMEEMIQTVRQYKETIVADDTDDRDIATVVHFYRDGNPVAIGVMNPDRDKMLQVIGICIPGLRCHGVSMAMETYQTSTRTNPSTGERWGPGEMQEYFDAGNKDEAVMEAITITAAALEGEPKYAVLPYSYQDGKLVWKEDSYDSEECTGAGGLVLDALKEFFANSLGTREKYAAMEAALPPDQKVNVEAMADALTMLVLVKTGLGGIVGLAVERNSEYEESVRHWFDNLDMGVHEVGNDDAGS
jgi:hypothetical protein